MHILTIARSYLGMSQMALAKAAGVTQPDVSEMETMAPYGQIDKYARISEFLGIPVDALVKNDCRAIAGWS